MLMRIEKQTIENIARNRLEENNIVHLFVKQVLTESKLIVSRKVNFRKRENQEAVQAYCEMALREFEGINARQKWANWRTIPKNLNGRIPTHAMRAIDLCCGTGDSTEVLACYLPDGSSILGLEYNPNFVKAARKREFVDKHGKPVAVQFNTQSVLETFTDAQGQAVADASIDLVNSCGAVGSHFNVDATNKLVAEIRRVLKKGGLATIDSGAPGTGKKQLIGIFQVHGFEVVHSAKSCLLDIFTQVCFRKL
jgi:ubiquinone/menaquinone biosynthesis C-methylase UbiE